jgi:6-phosphogluconolactonase/glucosamine-6-phosphate isomerase/deaminase
MGVSNVTILVSRTKSDLAEAAAARMVARIEENDGISAICLTGGSTPLALERAHSLVARPLVHHR